MVTLVLILEIAAFLAFAAAVFLDVYRGRLIAAGLACIALAAILSNSKIT